MEFIIFVIIILSVFILITNYLESEPEEKESNKKESKYRNSFNSYEYNSDPYEDFDKSYRDYKNRQREKSDEDERKSNKIINLLVKDFNANPYSDKINIITSDLIYYKFENGYRLKLSSGSLNNFIILSDRIGSTLGIYKLNSQQYHRVLNIFLHIARNSQRRPSNNNYRTYNQYDWDKKYNDYKREHNQEQKRSQPKQETTTGNPRLDKLNEKIKLRQEQLDKLPRNHKDRESLQNELNAYKRAAERIKTKN